MRRMRLAVNTGRGGMQTGDFNADGKSDLLWRDNSGNTAIWFLNGLQVSSTASLGNIPTSWTIQEVARRADQLCEVGDQHITPSYCYLPFRSRLTFQRSRSRPGIVVLAP